MELNKEIIAQTIKKLRLERGYNAIEIAKIAGISGSAISKIESGVNAPSPEVLLKLAECLNVSVDYLLMGQKENIEIDKSGDSEELEKSMKALGDTVEKAQVKIIGDFAKTIDKMSDDMLKSADIQRIFERLAKVCQDPTPPAYLSDAPVRK